MEVEKIMQALEQKHPGEMEYFLRKTVKHFHHKIVELGSRFPRDYAIIHSAVLSFVCFLATGIIPELTEKRTAFLLSGRGWGVPAEGASRPADLMRALCASRPAARFGQRRASGTSRGRKAGVDVFCGASLRQ